jgi:hypothetical protein
MSNPVSPILVTDLTPGLLVWQKEYWRVVVQVVPDVDAQKCLVVYEDGTVEYPITKRVMHKEPEVTP